MAGGMAGELAGKVAIVTGGASGIGHAAVELFAAEGAQVVIADTNVELGESVSVAAAREAREELGIDVYPAVMQPLTAMQRTLPGVADPVEQRVDYFLTTRVWEGEPTVQEPDKCAGLGWYSPAALPEPMVPHEGYLLGLMADGEVPPIVTFGY